MSSKGETGESQGHNLKLALDIAALMMEAKKKRSCEFLKNFCWKGRVLTEGPFKESLGNPDLKG